MEDKSTMICSVEKMKEGMAKRKMSEFLVVVEDVRREACEMVSLDV